MAPRGGRQRMPGTAKPLAGQVLFLDLRGFRGARRVEQQVVTLGARVAPIFNGEVSCVITNRNDIRVSHGSSSDKSFWAPPSRRKTAPKKEQQRSSLRRNRNNAVDVLATASAWGVQVNHVKLVLEWIDNFKIEQSSKKSTTSSRSPIARRRSPARKLRSRDVRQDTSSSNAESLCPRSDCCTKVGVCPFDTTLGPHSVQTRASTQRNGVSPRLSKTACNQIRANGFCELCMQSFDKNSSIQTILHEKYAKYWQNYDRLLRNSTSGPDINVFLRDLRKQKSPRSKVTKAKTRSSKNRHAQNTESRRSGRRASVSETPVSVTSPIEWSPYPTPANQRRTERNELRKRLDQIQRRLSFSGFDDDPFEAKILNASRRCASTPLLTTPKKRKLESSGSYTEILPLTRQRSVANSHALRRRTGSQQKPRRKCARLDVVKDRRSRVSKPVNTTGSSKRHHGRPVVKSSGRGKSVPKTPVSSSSPIERSPSPTPAKRRQAEKNELRRRLNQIQRRLSFAGFDDEPINSKILTGSRMRDISRKPKPPTSSPGLTTPRKRKLESSGSYTEILPSSRRSAPASKPPTKRAGRSAAPKTPVSTSSPIRRSGKRELRKRLKQIERRLSFTGFDDDPINSKILTGRRKRATPEKRRHPKSSSGLTTPKKQKLESSGRLAETLPSNRRSARGGRALRRNRTRSPAPKLPTRKDSRTTVMKDLMTRLDDAKATRLDNGLDVPDAPAPAKLKKPTKRRPRPRRTCARDYQKKRSKGAVAKKPTVTQVARELKRELAACTPVICTMSLRNGKMKFSES